MRREMGGMRTGEWILKERGREDGQTRWGGKGR